MDLKKFTDSLTLNEKKELFDNLYAELDLPKDGRIDIQAWIAQNESNMSKVLFTHLSRFTYSSLKYYPHIKYIDQFPACYISYTKARIEFIKLRGF